MKVYGQYRFKTESFIYCQMRGFWLFGWFIFPLMTAANIQLHPRSETLSQEKLIAGLEAV